MANCLSFKYDVPGHPQEDIMYWQPTRYEGSKCSRGINCDFGICDECQRTHNYQKEDDSIEDEETNDGSLSNNTN